MLNETLKEIIQALENQKEKLKELDNDNLLLKNEYIHKYNQINSTQLLIARYIKDDK